MVELPGVKGSMRQKKTIQQRNIQKNSEGIRLFLMSKVGKKSKEAPWVWWIRLEQTTLLFNQHWSMSQGVSSLGYSLV